MSNLHMQGKAFNRSMVRKSVFLLALVVSMISVSMLSGLASAVQHTQWFASDGIDQPMTWINYPASVSFQGYTYVVYQAGTGFLPTIQRLNETTHVWSGPVTLSATNPIAGDGHGAPSMVITPDGKIHVMYGAHISALKYVRGDVANFVSGWVAMTDPTSTATYPHLAVVGANLYVLYRNGDGYSGWTIKKSVNSGSSWNVGDQIIAFGAYVGGVEVSGTRIYMNLVYNANEAGTPTRENSYVAAFETTDSSLRCNNMDVVVDFDLSLSDANAFCKVESAAHSNFGSVHVAGDGTVFTQYGIGTEIDNGTWQYRLGKYVSGPYVGTTFDTTANFDAGTKSQSGGNYQVETLTDNGKVATGTLELGNGKGDTFSLADSDGDTLKWTPAGQGTGRTCTESITSGVYVIDITGASAADCRANSDFTVSGDFDVQAKYTSISGGTKWVAFCMITTQECTTTLGGNFGGSSSGVFILYLNTEIRGYKDVSGTLTQIGTHAGPSPNSPFWLRMTKSGTTYTYYFSTDGSAWTTITSGTITGIGTSWYVGMDAGVSNNDHDVWHMDDYQLSAGTVDSGGYRTSGDWQSASQTGTSGEFEYVNLTYSGASGSNYITAVSLHDSDGKYFFIDNTDLTSGTTHSYSVKKFDSLAWKVQVNLTGGGAGTPVVDTVSMNVLDTAWSISTVSFTDYFQDYGDFIATNSTSTEHFVLSNVTSQREGGNLERYTWDGVTFSHQGTVLTASSSGAPLTAPMVPLNFHEPVRVVFDQRIISLTSAKSKVYAFGVDGFQGNPIIGAACGVNSLGLPITSITVLVIGAALILIILGYLGFFKEDGMSKGIAMASFHPASWIITIIGIIILVIVTAVLLANLSC